MTAATYDFIPNADGRPYIEQGATFNQRLVYKDSNGLVVDLTGHIARMQIRANLLAPTVLLELTTENGGIVLGGNTGTIDLLISAEATAALTWTKGVYDLEVKRVSDGFVARLLEGAFAVSREVTR